MREDEITHDRVSHLLRTGDGGLAVAGGEALDLDDEVVLVLQPAGHLVERIFGLLAQTRLAGAEANFGLRAALVAVEAANHIFRCGNAGRGTARGRLRLLRASRGIGGVRIGQRGLLRRKLQTVLGAGVDVFDGVSVGRGQLIQFA